MMPSARCPDVRDLQRLLLGELPPAQADPLARHLLECDRCAQAVQSLPEAPPPADAPPPPVEDALPDGLGNHLGPPEAPGELGRLGNYRLLKVLGSGAMAVVFQAEDVRLGREVALKVLKPALAEGSLARRRFIREAKATAAIEHDHVIALFEVNEDRGLPFLAMPLLRGESLHDCLRRQKQATPPWLPLVDVLRIGRQIAEGLAAAHDRGIVHRDVKPANIWLEKRSGEAGEAVRVKLLDFGIVRVADEDQRLTASGALVGTPAYMAPEQAVSRNVDHRCDLFSLGCILYRMATGQLAFNGPNPPAIVIAVKTAEPTPPEQHNPALPAALVALIRRLLTKDREQRPASAREVAASLRAIEEAGPDQPIALAQVPRAVPTEGPSHRKTWMWVLAGVAGALIVAALLWRRIG